MNDEVRHLYAMGNIPYDLFFASCSATNSGPVMARMVPMMDRVYPPIPVKSPDRRCAYCGRRSNPDPRVWSESCLSCGAPP